MALSQQLSSKMKNMELEIRVDENMICMYELVQVSHLKSKNLAENDKAKINWQITRWKCTMSVEVSGAMMPFQILSVTAVQHLCERNLRFFAFAASSRQLSLWKSASGRRISCWMRIESASLQASNTSKAKSLKALSRQNDEVTNPSFHLVAQKGK